MPLLDEFWKYAQSDWPTPILSIPISTTKTDEFSQMVRIGLVREGKRHRFIECPCCQDHSDEPQASELPDGTLHFMLACPNCGAVEVTAEDMRVWCIHFSELPGMMAVQLGMREPQVIVPDALWKLGQYGDVGDIWLARWLQYPEARDWLPKVPKTPQTVLLYLGPPPDFSMLADMPQGNVLDAADIISADDAGLHLNMKLVDAALMRSAIAAASPDICVFRQEGKDWLIVYEGKILRLKNSIGLACIHHLLMHPGEYYAASILRKLIDPDFQDIYDSCVDSVTDDESLRQYARRLEFLDGEIAEAEALQDMGRLEAHRKESDALRTRMKQDKAFGGHVRTFISEEKKIHATLLRNVSRSIDAFKNVHDPLWRHLFNSIKKRNSFSYQPETDMRWTG